mmetsp:Transcript_45036/g.81255  ORF Transcript_45036/g.81255 Transcript_45036/m.81255 type:complete len:286 (+) Transcript_45036:101-958(+)
MHRAALVLAFLVCTSYARVQVNSQGAASQTGTSGKSLPDGIKVFIATPAYGGMVAVEYTLAVVKMVSTLSEVSWVLELTGGASIITVGRNNLVMQFLESDCTHLLFLDADLHADVDTIRGLLALDVDVALAPYPIKNFNEQRIQETAARTGNPARLRDGLHYNLHAIPEKFIEAMETGNRYMEVDAGPTGCMLIKRGVFNRMIDAYPNLSAKIHGSKEGRPYHYEKWWRFFDTMVTPEGDFLGEDIAFCRLWRSIGGKIYADMQAVLTHVGRQAFTGSLSEFLLT